MTTRPANLPPPPTPVDRPRPAEDMQAAARDEAQRMRDWAGCQPTPRRAFEPEQMMAVVLRCAHCRAKLNKRPGDANRAIRNLLPLYCDRTCFGLARRVERSEVERKAAKAAYDREYRAANFDRIKAEKHAWFRANYDPAKAAIERKATMSRHVEYCRRPEYRAWKAEYDRQYKARLHFNEYADAAMLLQDLEREILSQATRYEIYLVNGRFNKAQRRRRAL